MSKNPGTITFLLLKKAILNHLVQNEVEGVKKEDSGTWKIIALALYIFWAGIRWAPWIASGIEMIIVSS